MEICNLHSFYKENEVTTLIKSMTGFGRGEVVSDQCKITVEIKAVNHRYCDLNIKMPKKLNSLEASVRNRIKESVSRGKIDVYIGFENLSERGICVRLNEALGREYYRVIKELGENLGIADDVTAYRIARMPEVLSVEEELFDLEGTGEQLLKAVGLALLQFVESREKEGTHLKADIFQKLEGMKSKISVVEERYPELAREYRARLEEKVKELLEDSTLDEGRIAAEVVIYSDKICVDEETVRLRSHIRAMEEELRSGGNVGRKLDFIAQEMNREANTILSKSNDMSVSGAAIDLKTEIEKIREQVQNIE